MVCLCTGCAPKQSFNSAECMWCQKGLQGMGKLISPNGARVCQDCIKKAAEALEKAIKGESNG